MKTHLLKVISGKIVLLVSVVVLLSASAAFSQWVQLSGLNGEPVYNIRANSTKLFAVTLNGALVSDNDGASWSIIPDLYLTNIVESISASGDTIVAYAIPENYISTDNGNTWNELNPPPGMIFYSGLLVDNGKIYMPTSGDYLYTSIDGGNNWTQINQGLTTSEIVSIHTDGAEVYLGTDDGVFKSSDFGVTFAFSGLSGEYVTRIYSSSPYVFAFGNSSVFRSDDNGATWGLFEPLIPYADITDFFVDGNIVYAATSGDLISSNVFTAAWSSVTFTENIEYNFSLCKKGSNIFVGSNRSVYASDDGGATWSAANEGITPVNVAALTVLNNDTVFAGASIAGVSFYDGSDWNFSGISLLNSNDLYTNGGDVFSASEFGIHKSSDGGLTWDLINNVFGNPVISFCTDVAVSDTLIVGGALQNGILRSGDYGLTWTLENTGIAPSLVSCVDIIDDNIVVGTFDNGLFLSQDGGFNWTPVHAPGEYIYDLTVNGGNIIAAGSTPNGNYVSTDKGLTWAPVFSDGFEHLSTNGDIVVASSASYIQLSVDSGLTYQFNTPPPAGAAIASSFASNTDVYIGTYSHGVWKMSISEITSLPFSESVTLGARIYPNVFNTESFLYVDDQLVNSGSELYITDMNGKIVKIIDVTSSRTLVPAGNLSPGIYLYKVINNVYQTKSGKIVVH